MNFASSYVYVGDEELDDVAEAPVQAPLAPEAAVAAPMPEDRERDRDRARSRSPPAKKQEEKAKAVAFERERPAPKPLMKKPMTRKATTNIVSVQLGSLEENAQLATGDPTFCSSCKAVYSVESHKRAKVSPSDAQSYAWDCEFCGAHNELRLDDAEIPKGNTVDYLLEPAKVPVSNTNDFNIVFCIDISGSMCQTQEVTGGVKLRSNASKISESLKSFNDGSQQRLPREQRNVTYVSRLQCVQAALESQLDTLALQHPQAKVGLVVFNNEVQIIGDGSQEVSHVTGDRLHELELLRAAGSKFTTARAIKDCKEILRKKLFDLEESGPTALGPAVAVSIAMACTKPGSKIVIATDGLSNVGIGSLEAAKQSDANRNQVEQFYREQARIAKEHGLTVNLVSIRGEGCNIEALGVLADETGGEVTIVDPLKIHENFANMLANQLLASNCQIKMILHKEFKFREEDDENSQVMSAVAGEKEKAQGATTLSKEIGNVYKDSEVSFEFEVRKKNFAGQQQQQQQQKQQQQQATPAPAAVASAALPSPASPVVSPPAPPPLPSPAAAAGPALPFQVQIVYTKLNGDKCIRVITQTKETTTDRNQAEAHLNYKVLAINAHVKSAKLASRGDYDGAMGYNIDNDRLMQRAQHLSPANLQQYNQVATMREGK